MRQYWVNPTTEQVEQYFENFPDPIPPGGIHVIEYAAYKKQEETLREALELIDRLETLSARAWHESTGETFPVRDRSGKISYWYTFRPEGDSCLNSGPAQWWRIVLYKLGITRVKWFADYYRSKS